MGIFRRISLYEASIIRDLLSDILEGYENLEEQIEEGVNLMNEVVESTMTEDDYRAFAKKFVELCDGSPRDPANVTEAARDYAHETFAHDPDQMILAQRYVDEVLLEQEGEAEVADSNGE